MAAFCVPNKQKIHIIADYIRIKYIAFDTSASFTNQVMSFSWQFVNLGKKRSDHKYVRKLFVRWLIDVEKS